MQRETDPSTRDLARRARAGDSAAFADLYSRVAPSIAAWARVRLQGIAASVEPDDVVHEVCYRAHCNFEQYDADLAPFRAWLFGIAKRVMLENLRSSRSRMTSVEDEFLAELPAVISTASQKVLGQEDAKRVAEVAKGLDEADRKLLLLRGLEGLPHARVAELLELTPAAAQRRWSRLVAKLSSLGLSDELLNP